VLVLVPVLVPVPVPVPVLVPMLVLVPVPVPVLHWLLKAAAVQTAFLRGLVWPQSPMAPRLVTPPHSITPDCVRLWLGSVAPLDSPAIVSLLLHILSNCTFCLTAHSVALHILSNCTFCRTVRLPRTRTIVRFLSVQASFSFSDAQFPNRHALRSHPLSELSLPRALQ
jgi:hypothetical protein